MASSGKETQDTRQQSIQKTLDTIKALKMRQKEGDSEVALTIAEQNMLNTEADLVEELRKLTDPRANGASKDPTFVVAVQQDRTNMIRFTCTTSDTFGDLKHKIVRIIR